MDQRVTDNRDQSRFDFIRGWISKHPDYVDLVPASQRAKFGL